MGHYLVISGESNWAYSMELEPERSYRIGRASDNDVVLRDSRVSSYHARLGYENGRFFLNDLGSRNGTRVNDRQVTNAYLAPGDKVMIGLTKLHYLTKLNLAELTSTAVLSPRLSQPLLKTQTNRLRDLIAELGVIQDQLSRNRMGEDEMHQTAERVGRIVRDLGEVELQTRTLIGMNHFHELFHGSTQLRQLLNDALRFLMSVVEAENGALLMFEPGGGMRVESTTGLGVAGWTTQVPVECLAVIDHACTEKRSIYVRNAGESTFWGMNPEKEASADMRSIIAAPILTTSGRLIASVYFDNRSRPHRLNNGELQLVEGCLRILADHLTGERQDSSRPAKSNDSQTEGAPPQPKPVAEITIVRERK